MCLNNNTWARADVAAVRIPLNDPITPTPSGFQMATSSCKVDSLTNLTHCLQLKVSSLKVLFARPKTSVMVTLCIYHPPAGRP